eukprot:2345171-Karenia_brevis.AAC.1
MGPKLLQNRSWRRSWNGLEAILAPRANKTSKSLLEPLRPSPLGLQDGLMLGPKPSQKRSEVN